MQHKKLSANNTDTQALQQRLQTEDGLVRVTHNTHTHTHSRLTALFPGLPG